MNIISYNDLPEAVSKLIGMVETMLQILQNHPENGKDPTADQWMTLKTLIAYLPDNPTEGSIYKKVFRKEIPYHKPAGRLLFLKSEIDQYLMSGSTKTPEQISSEADKLLSGMKRKKK
ncbi:MAG TPA: helix-turn-helix domain-containing protein [Bacteroidales bacterium]|nr:helix-turn-helix domain-containing protein [Bacteroidales bacterium]